MAQKFIQLNMFWLPSPGLGIDNVMIDLDIEEIPIQDGSSKYFVQALQEAGIVEQECDKELPGYN